jgi:hypothetical protein
MKVLRTTVGVTVGTATALVFAAALHAAAGASSTGLHVRHDLTPLRGYARTGGRGLRRARGCHTGGNLL